MKPNVIALALVAVAGCRSSSRDAANAPDRPPGWIDSARFAGADREPEQWLSAGRGPYEQYYSPVDKINPTNADGLGLAWEYTARSTRGRVQHGMQATAIVVDGVMYVSGP